MPIKGLTDRVTPAFPRIGKLRKGAARTEEDIAKKRPGSDLDFFRFTSDNEDVVTAFEKAYGNEPRELDVYLPYAKLDDDFSTWQEKWSAGGLHHRCDGETCTVWLQPDGTYTQEPKPCPGGCAKVGRLCFIIPHLLRAGHVGDVTLETHSVHDILSIQSSLLSVIEHRGVEDLRGIGFVLRRTEQSISMPTANGKRVRRKKWLVRLEPAAKWVVAQLENSQLLALPNGEQDEADGEDAADEERATEEESVSPAADETIERTRKETPWAEFMVEAGSHYGLTTKEMREILGDLAQYEKKLTPMAAAKKVLEDWREKQDGPAADGDDPLDELRKRIRDKALRGGTDRVEPGLMGLCVNALESLFPDDLPEIAKQKRYGLLKFFFGKESAKHLKRGEASALLDWAQENKAPRPKAIREAGYIIELRDLEAGQESLFDEDLEGAEELEF